MPQPLAHAQTRRNHSQAALYKRPLGEILVRTGRLTASSLDFALDLQSETGGRLGDILVAHHFTSAEEICDALSAQTKTPRAIRPPSVKNIPGSAEFWINLGMFPWQYSTRHWKIAASDTIHFHRNQPEITRLLGKNTMVWASQDQITAAQETHFRRDLLTRAEQRLDPAVSCRGFSPRRARVWGAVVLTVIMISIALLDAMSAVLLALPAVVVASALMSAALKCYISFANLDRLSAQRRPNAPDIFPKITVLVPLFHETRIAERLIERLQALNYPRSHLEIILLSEQTDPQTRAVLIKTPLPRWIKILNVPQGQVQTKPRAMNYALPFCKGDIIGIYDAEDAPEPDQLIKVAAQFAHAPQNVVCLQGRLDFYNTHSNWLARCFTIEYATWFRVILPGLARLGGVIPLGGTTLFFRRSALDHLQDWDAHNVTEDADLGVRLSLHGWRCDILDSTTFEEANNRPLAWVKQRSRWLKGYAMTYFVHMRNPLLLWKSLGGRQFLLMQIVFLHTLITYTLAPIFWALWLLTLGWADGPALGLTAPYVWALVSGCIFAQLVEFLISFRAVRASGHIALGQWIFTMPFYFPLGTFAMYKAWWEIFTTPFYWDKTDHG